MKLRNKDVLFQQMGFDVCNIALGRVVACAQTTAPMATLVILVEHCMTAVEFQFVYLIPLSGASNLPDFLCVSLHDFWDPTNLRNDQRVSKPRKMSRVMANTAARQLMICRVPSLLKASHQNLSSRSSMSCFVVRRGSLPHASTSNRTLLGNAPQESFLRSQRSERTTSCTARSYSFAACA